MPRASVLLSVRLLFWRMRALLVVAGLLLAAGAVARQAAPPTPPAEPVVVAAHDLTAGQPLAAGDLRVVRMPAGLVPDGATSDPSVLVDRAVTAGVPSGLPVVAAQLDGDRFGLAMPAGTVAVPIRLADPAVAGLLRPGDRVDLVAPTGVDGWAGTGAGTEAAPATVLARGALVLEVLDRVAEDGNLLGGWASGSASGSTVGSAEPLVVVAVAPQEGHLLAASGWGSLGAVLVEGS